ncbi:hypothetical protein GCM10010388_45910 [Streptomyces mauvecolor]
MDTEVGGHLLDRHARAAVPRDPHDVLAELFRIRLGHSDILPTRPTGQASSDVTRSCSRPKAGDAVVERVDGGASSAVKALLWGIEVPPTVACDRHRSVVQTRVIR